MSQSYHNKGILIPIRRFLKFTVLYGSLMILVTCLSYFIEKSHLHQHQNCNAIAEEHCNEKDPCHLKLEHGNLADGCKHNTHLSLPHKLCTKCKAISQLKPVYFPFNLRKDIALPEYSSIFNYTAFVVFRDDEQINSRGPPILII